MNDTQNANKLNIGQIGKGVVLDHITAGRGMSIFQYLQLEKLDCSVALIKNVVSNKMGKKDIIKIEDRIDIDMDALGYIDPDITVIKVENSRISSKQKLSLPKTLKNVIKCKNPRCITSIEQGIVHIFDLADTDNRIYRCRYCEQENK